jgi:hypothetical protein
MIAVANDTSRTPLQATEHSQLQLQEMETAIKLITSLFLGVLAEAGTLAEVVVRAVI